jgi:hypothetical protein
LLLAALLISAFSCGEATAASVSATGSYGQVRCGHAGERSGLILSFEVGKKAKTDEIALIHNQKWTFLTGGPGNISQFITIDHEAAFTKVSVPLNKILPILAKTARRGERNDFDFSVRLGQGLDSEDSIEVVGCRFLYKK